MTAPAARPRQVRLACTLAGFGAGFVLLNIFSVMAGWPPAALREELESLLAEPRFADAGLSVDTVLSWLRVMLMIVAAGCVASIVLAVHTARHHRGARVALSVLLPVTALGSLSVGLPGLLLLAVAVPSVVLLWQRDARAWFMTASERASTSAGPVPPPPRVSAYEPPKEHPPTMSSQPPENEGQSSGSSYPGSPQSGPPYPGPSYSGPSAPPAYGQPPQPYGQPPYGGYGEHGGQVVPRQRPGQVVAAAVITIVMATITGGFWLIMGIAAVAASDQIVDEVFKNAETSRAMAEANVTRAELVDWIGVGGVVALVAGVVMLLAIIPAIGLLRGSGVSRILITVAAGISAAIAVWFVITGGFFAVIWLAAGIIVIVLLFTGGVGAWLDAKSHRRESAGSR